MQGCDLKNATERPFKDVSLSLKNGENKKTYVNIFIQEVLLIEVHTMLGRRVWDYTAKFPSEEEVQKVLSLLREGSEITS